MTRILINPDSLRSTARSLNEAASEYGLLARAIGGLNLSGFSPDTRPLAAQTSQRAARELAAISAETSRRADELRRRAGLVEQPSWYEALLRPIPTRGTTQSISESVERLGAWLTRNDVVERLREALGHLENADTLLTLAGSSLRKWQNQFGSGLKIASRTSFVRYFTRVSRTVPVASVLAAPLSFVGSLQDYGERRWASGQRQGLDKDDIETAGDQLGMASSLATVTGAVLLLTPLAPVGGALILGGLGTGVVSTGIDLVLDQSWAGPRKAWNKGVSGVKKSLGFGG